MLVENHCFDYITRENTVNREEESKAGNYSAVARCYLSFQRWQLEGT